MDLFVVGSGGDELGKGLVVDLASADWWIALVHGLDLVLREGVTTLVRQDLLQLVLRDEALKSIQTLLSPLSVHISQFITHKVTSGRARFV